MELKVKRLHPDAILPKYATDGAACFDLHALADGDEKASDLPAFAAGTVRTGLSFEVPPGYALMIYSRSGHGFKNSVRLANAVGVLDSDYRGECMVRLSNDGGQPFRIAHGDRIAQAMLVQVPQVSLVEVEELSETARGDGGFGSTGR